MRPKIGPEVGPRDLTHKRAKKAGWEGIKKRANWPKLGPTHFYWVGYGGGGLRLGVGEGRVDL